MKKLIIFSLLLIISLYFYGCAATYTPTTMEGKPIIELPLLFQPLDDVNVKSYFINGNPLAYYKDDSMFVLISLDKVAISDIKYMRLWTLYQNVSSADYLLTPQDNFSISFKGKTKNYENIKPTFPSKILNDIENEKQKDLIWKTIGATLQSLSTIGSKDKVKINSETITYDNNSNIESKTKTDGTITIDDSQEKQNQIAQDFKADFSNTVYWYESYKNSFSNGVLRRNTLFPSQGINGYVYFELPSTKISSYDTETSSFTSTSTGNFINPYDYTVSLNLITQNGVKEIKFKVIEGE